MSYEIDILEHNLYMEEFRDWFTIKSIIANGKYDRMGDIIKNAIAKKPIKNSLTYKYALVEEGLCMESKEMTWRRSVGQSRQSSLSERFRNLTEAMDKRHDLEFGLVFYISGEYNNSFRLEFEDGTVINTDDIIETYRDKIDILRMMYSTNKSNEWNRVDETVLFDNESIRATARFIEADIVSHDSAQLLLAMALKNVVKPCAILEKNGFIEDTTERKRER